MIVIARISRTGDPTLATTCYFSSILSSTESNTNLGSDMEEHYNGISIWLLAILGQTHPNCVGKVCFYIFWTYMSTESNFLSEARLAKLFVGVSGTFKRILDKMNLKRFVRPVRVGHLGYH